MTEGDDHERLSVPIATGLSDPSAWITRQTFYETYDVNPEEVYCDFAAGRLRIKRIVDFDSESGRYSHYYNLPDIEKLGYPNRLKREQARQSRQGWAQVLVGSAPVPLMTLVAQEQLFRKQDESVRASQTEELRDSYRTSRWDSRIVEVSVTSPSYSLLQAMKPPRQMPLSDEERASRMASELANLILHGKTCIERAPHMITEGRFLYGTLLKPIEAVYRLWLYSNESAAIQACNLPPSIQLMMEMNRESILFNLGCSWSQLRLKERAIYAKPGDVI